MADIKQKMPAGATGKSTNPAATTGGGAAPTNNGKVSDAGQNAKNTFTQKDPARGNHKNGDFSQ